MGKVTKRADLLARIRREEEAKRFAVTYADEGLEDIAVDLFDTVVAAFKLTLAGLPYSEEMHGELYAQIEGFRQRLANKNVTVEWEE